MDPCKYNLPAVSREGSVHVLSQPTSPALSIPPSNNERRLTIQGHVEYGEGEPAPVQFLVDTGAELCIIRRGIIPERFLERLEKPWKLTAANQQRLVGGEFQATVSLCLKGTQVDTGYPQVLKIPTTFVVADVGHLEAILSYSWLVDNNFLVNGSRHGICQMNHNSPSMVWIPGERTKGQIATVQAPSRVQGGSESLPSSIHRPGSQNPLAEGETSSSSQGLNSSSDSEPATSVQSARPSMNITSHGPESNAPGVNTPLDSSSLPSQVKFPCEKKILFPGAVKKTLN